MNPHLERGLLLFHQSRHEMAEAEFRQALAIEPHDAHTHALLALCLAHRKEFQEATAEVQQAIHLQPDLSFTHYAHAHVLFDRNRFDEALEAIQEAIRLDPSDADYFALLANIQCQERRWPAALEAAEQGLQYDPEHVGCTNLRAIAMVKLGRKAEAGVTIDAALAKNPDSALTHANQGWTLLEKGEPKKALEHFREALRLDPENDWARSGTVEALKARNFIYAAMLKYFLWMSRFSSRGQWGIILGGFIGNRILGVVAATNPQLAPWILPIRILYVIFALMTWMAYPFFNLLLRLNRFGRHVLSPEQTAASNWFGLCLLCGLIAIAGAFALHSEVWFIAAVVFGLLLLPVSAVYKCESGWPRTAMASLALVTLALGLGAVGFSAAAAYDTETSSKSGDLFSEGPFGLLFGLFIIGVMASTWLTNIFASRRIRH